MSFTAKVGKDTAHHLMQTFRLQISHKASVKMVQTRCASRCLSGPCNTGGFLCRASPSKWSPRPPAPAPSAGPTRASPRPSNDGGRVSPRPLPGANKLSPRPSNDGRLSPGGRVSPIGGRVSPVGGRVSPVGAGNYPSAAKVVADAHAAQRQKALAAQQAQRQQARASLEEEKRRLAQASCSTLLYLESTDCQHLTLQQTARCMQEVVRSIHTAH